MLRKVVLCATLLLSSSAFAACVRDGCWGAVGFDSKNMKVAQKVNYDSKRNVQDALLAQCPGCKDNMLVFRNGCGSIAYSPSHGKIYKSAYSDLKSGSTQVEVLNECEKDTDQLQLEKYKNDKRRSNRRVTEKDKGACVAVVSACTDTYFVEYYYY